MPGACDRSGVTTDCVLTNCRKAAVMALLEPLLPTVGVAYHSRLKTWGRRFHGVATFYLENCLGWFSALDRMPRNPARPAQLPALAPGR